MKTSNLLAVVLTVVGLGSGGCGFSGSANLQPAVPTGAPTQTIRAGAGTFVAPGTQAGYGIIANESESSFRLIWTGDVAASGTYRVFEGSIYTTGHFVSVNPGCGGDCAFESGDYISQPIPTPGGERIDFDTTATAGLDGIDFKTDREPVYFDLLIDGLRDPERIFFTDGMTGSMATAAALPFGLAVLHVAAH